MEIVFANKQLERIIRDERKLLREMGKHRASILRFRFAQFNDAECLEDLRSMPGHYHELTGNRKGQWSCNLDQPYRLIFTADHSPIPTNEHGGYDWKSIRKVSILEIVNYHND